MSLLSEQHSKHHLQAYSLLRPLTLVLLHRTQLKRDPCAARYLPGRTDIPKIHP